MASEDIAVGEAVADGAADEQDDEEEGGGKVNPMFEYSLKFMTQQMPCRSCIWTWMRKLIWGPKETSK